MSRLFVHCLFLSLGFPRVSGDEPVDTGAVTILTKFSPRERG